MPEPDNIDKRLEKELDEILGEQAKGRPRGRRPSSGGGLSPRAIDWRRLTQRALLLAAVLVVVVLLVRLGPLVALRALPVLLRVIPILVIIALALYVLIQLPRLLRR